MKFVIRNILNFHRLLLRFQCTCDIYRRILQACIKEDAGECTVILDGYFVEVAICTVDMVFGIQ